MKTIIRTLIIVLTAQVCVAQNVTVLNCSNSSVKESLLSNAGILRDNRFASIDSVKVNYKNACMIVYSSSSNSIHEIQSCNFQANEYLFSVMRESGSKLKLKFMKVIVVNINESYWPITMNRYHKLSNSRLEDFIPHTKW